MPDPRGEVDNDRRSGGVRLRTPTLEKTIQVAANRSETPKLCPRRYLSDSRRDGIESFNSVDHIVVAGWRREDVEARCCQSASNQNPQICIQRGPRFETGWNASARPCVAVCLAQLGRARRRLSNAARTARQGERAYFVFYRFFHGEPRFRLVIR